MYNTQSDHRQDLLPCHPPPPRPIVMERRWKPNVELAPNCPRCHSSNTKFCYYNNYSLTQPRYFCKSCRRYWTKGGSLRDVPIGGGCRKNRRAKSVPISTGNSRPSNNPYANSPDPNSMASSNNPTLSDSATIDLALVYAKFLEQRPVPELPRELELPQNFDSHIEFSSHELVGCVSEDTQLSEGHQQVLFSEFGSLEDTNSYELQPLPQSDDMAMNEMFWSNSPVVGSNFSWQQTPATPQLQGFEPTVHDDHSNIPLDDNWNSFDLPSFEAFSKP